MEEEKIWEQMENESATKYSQFLPFMHHSNSVITITDFITEITDGKYSRKYLIYKDLNPTSIRKIALENRWVDRRDAYHMSARKKAAESERLILIEDYKSMLRDVSKSLCIIAEKSLENILNYADEALPPNRAVDVILKLPAAIEKLQPLLNPTTDTADAMYIIQKKFVDLDLSEISEN